MVLPPWRPGSIRKDAHSFGPGAGAANSGKRRGRQRTRTIPDELVAEIGKGLIDAEADSGGTGASRLPVDRRTFLMRSLIGKEGPRWHPRRRLVRMGSAVAAKVLAIRAFAQAPEIFSASPDGKCQLGTSYSAAYVGEGCGFDVEHNPRRRSFAAHLMKTRRARFTKS